MTQVQGRIALSVSVVGLLAAIIGVIINANSLVNQLKKKNHIQLSQQMITLVQELNDPATDLKKAELAKNLLIYYGEDALPVLLNQVETTGGVQPATQIAIQAIINADEGDDAAMALVNAVTLRIKDIKQIQITTGNHNWEFFNRYIRLLDQVEFTNRHERAVEKILKTTIPIETELELLSQKEPSAISLVDLSPIKVLNERLKKCLGCP